MLCYEEDQLKAERVQEKLLKHCSYVKIYVPPAGVCKVEACCDFIDTCHIVLWLATPKSCSDQYMEAYKRFSQHEAIVSKAKLFVPLLPQENLKLRLPRSLQAVTPLKEDDKFDKSVETTLKWFQKKNSNLVVENAITEPHDANYEEQQKVTNYIININASVKNIQVNSIFCNHSAAMDV